MFNMFFSAGMPPITNKALELLGAEQGAFIWVAGDGHVISLTERANALTGMHPMQSIYEILSERATVTLRLCFSEQTEQTIDEVLDDVMYHLTISTMGEESALLLFRERLQKSALHDLTDLQIRSALGVIRMVSDTMKTIPERQNRERCMAQMEKACMRIERAVGHAEQIAAPMRAETLYLREVDLAELCREGAEKLRELVPETVQVNAREIPAVFLWVCDREQVEIALYNLLTNAVNAHASKIGIALYRREYAVDITVSDNGVGLSPGAAFRLHNAWQLPLTDTEMLTRVASHEAPGMGVPLIFRAAALHGGVVRYEPNGTQGTKVRFILPDGLREDPNNLHCPFRFDNAQSISNLELSGLR